MKKAVAVLLSLILCLSLLLPAVYAEDAYMIKNPYAGIDWERINQYKTALHCHTNASDGDFTLKQVLRRHLETGFDIVAVTDHGVVDTSWAEGPDRNLIKTVLSVLGRSEGDLDYLGSAGTFSDGTAYAYSSVVNGDAYLRAGDRVILKLPYGVENNAVSVNAHVNSWFVNGTDNSVTTYRDAVARVDRAGGLCVVNHPGEYTKARYEIESADAYNEENPAYAYYINKYADLIDRYPACIGIDMNSKGDDRTRFDRILWDRLLTRFSANGGTVAGIASSDAHQLDKIDTGFTVLLMPVLSSPAAFRALENGEFFAASHCVGNYDEVAAYRDAVAAFYGTDNETYRRLSAAADEMRDRIEGIKSGKYKADERIGATYTVLDGEGYTTVDTFPKITAVAVDDSENTIEVKSENALFVRYVSNGKTVAIKKADDAAIDLDTCAGLGDYVRAEVFGDGGVLYTQAFLLNAEAKEGSSKVTKGITELGFFDFLFAEFNRLFAILRRVFSRAL